MVVDGFISPISRLTVCQFAPSNSSAVVIGLLLEELGCKADVTGVFVR